MDENYEELFRRIRAKCRQQRWHGPDGSNPFEIVKQERIRQEKELESIRQRVRNGRTFVVRSSSTRYWYDRDRKQYAINLDTDLDNFPLQTDFEYPHLTEEEMAAIERNRRYPFPPLLRALYTTVANGGFGPGYGLTTLSTPAPIADGSSRKRHERSIDLAVYLCRYGSSEYFEFPWYVWPDSLFLLCEWGCGYDFWLDCVSGRVFYGGAGRDGFGLLRQARSLEEWLDLWIKDIDFSRRIEVGEQHDE